METKYVLLYGGDTCCNGTKLGRESHRRISALLQFLIMNRKERFCIILAPGSNPDHPDYPLLKTVMNNSLSRCLLNLCDKGRLPYIPEILLIEEDVWNTAQESLAAALLLEKIGVNELFVVSSWYHMGRIRMIWKMIGGFTIHPVKAQSGRYSSVLREMLAILKVNMRDRKFLIDRKLPLSPSV